MRHTFICRNEACSLNGKPRSVSLLHLGQALYQWGSVFCVCGNSAWPMGSAERSSAETAPTGGRPPAGAERSSAEDQHWSEYYRG